MVIELTDRERQVLNSLQTTMDVEYTTEYERWKLATDYVLPYVKYNDKPNERARKTGALEFLANELTKAYSSLCTPMTKKWFKVLEYDEDLDNFSYNVDLQTRFTDFLKLGNSSFYEQIEKAILHAAVFGQSLIYVDQIFKEKKIIFRFVPQYNYRLYFRDNIIYAVEWKKTVTPSVFQSQFDEEVSTTGTSVEYSELWVNNKEFPTADDRKTGWSVFSHIEMPNNAFLTKSDISRATFSVANGGHSAVFDIKQVSNDNFPFVYMPFTRRDDTSYGLSPVVSAIDDVANWQTLEGLILDGIDNKLRPPMVVTQSISTPTILDRQKIIPTSSKDARSAFVPVIVSGNAEVFAQQKMQFMEASLRRFLGLEDLQFIANSIKQPTQGAYYESYKGRLDTVYPLVLKVLHLMVVPFTQRVFSLFVKTLPNDLKKSIKNIDNIVCDIFPPILELERTLSKLPEVDMAILKLSTFAQLDPSILDKINFDKVITALFENDTEMDDYLRTDKEVAELRQNRAKAQNMLAEAQADKDRAQAEKNRAAARANGSVSQIPQQGFAQQPDPSLDQQQQPQQEQVSPDDFGAAGLDSFI